MKAFLGRPLDHARFPYVNLDATYRHGRLCRKMQVCSRAVVVAIGINALGYREVLGIAEANSEPLQVLVRLAAEEPINNRPCWALQ